MQRDSGIFSSINNCGIIFFISNTFLNTSICIAQYACTFPNHKQMYSFAQIVLDALILPIHAVLKVITGNLLLLFKFIIKNKKHKHKIHNSDYFNKCKETWRFTVKRFTSRFKITVFFINIVLKLISDIILSHLEFLQQLLAIG